MNRRPKKTDSEDDILEMQKAFAEEKKRGNNFQPAAKVIRIAKKQSLFAKSRQENKSGSNKEKESKIPKYILGDIVEREKPREEIKFCNTIKDENNEGFPQLFRVPFTINPGNKSFFAQSMEQGTSKKESYQNQNISNNMPGESCIIQDTNLALEIHEQNKNLLEVMTEDEILKTKENLMQSIDPTLLAFIEDQRKRKFKQSQSNCISKQPKTEDTKNNIVSQDKSCTIQPSISEVVDLFDKSQKEGWINFNIFENEKLEWMKDVSNKIKTLKPGESFEARFDWKGILLPYCDSSEISDDNRELYQHGEEPHRPGYTLQELFKLSRSNILQQRIAAFGAIAGILNIYSQSLYDDVLVLPITKIFFLLRFGFDDNTTAVLEPVSHGLANLFYNSIDESILDRIYEISEGYLQPKIEILQEKKSKSNDEDNLEQSLANLKLNTPVVTSINEDEEMSKTNMSDFQMAETDLIECLLRTNIIQRLSYILGTVKPINSSVFACLKLLIRIARTNKESAQKIVANNELLEILFQNFLPNIEDIDFTTKENLYQFPQHMVLKLFRIIISHHISFWLKLKSKGVTDKLKMYLFLKNDIKEKLIKVQIESMRMIHTMMLTVNDIKYFRELIPAFRYILEWHYQHEIFAKEGPDLIRQHAAALITVISSGPITDLKSFLGETLQICFCKWFHDATRSKNIEFSQSILLTACLNCVARFMVTDIILFKDFTEKYLKKFCESSCFKLFTMNLSKSSILLRKGTDRRNNHTALPNLGAVTNYQGEPKLLVHPMYPVYLFNAIYKVLEISELKTRSILIFSLMNSEITSFINNYLCDLSKYINKGLGINYFAKAEIKFVFKLLSQECIRTIFSKDVLFQITFNIISCMTAEYIEEIERLFEEIIFKEDNLGLNQSILSQWKKVYMDNFIYPHSIIISATDLSLCVPAIGNPLLPAHWPYLPLDILLQRHLNLLIQENTQCSHDITETDIITMSLTFSQLLEKINFQIISPTEKLIYLMMVFLGSESKFLEPEIKVLIKTQVLEFYRVTQSIVFEFDKKFEGKKSFENFYKLFLDQFQAASYGDNIFSSLVLVPLSQKYNGKWRKIVWSEYAAVLKFLNCDESQLFGSIDDYLYPEERDESIIICYSKALNSNLLRLNSIPFRIAKHHVNRFKNEFRKKISK